MIDPNLRASLVVYIAGPMLHIPELNFPLFKRTAERLRQKGFTVISPVEIGDELCGNDPSTPSSTFLKRDITVMLEKCNAITLLPGWDGSTGATLEAAIARSFGYTFISNCGCEVLDRPVVVVNRGYANAS